MLLTPLWEPFLLAKDGWRLIASFILSFCAFMCSLYLSAVVLGVKLALREGGKLELPMPPRLRPLLPPTVPGPQPGDPRRIAPVLGSCPCSKTGALGSRRPFDCGSLIPGVLNLV